MAITSIIKLPFDSGDDSLPRRVRDTLISGDNGGVRFLADFGFPWSYPGGPIALREAATAPIDGATVYDMTQRQNSTTRISQPGGVAYAGGGLDFSGVTERNNYIELPAGIADDLWTPFSGNSQLFLVSLYLKMPNLAEWDEIAQFFNSAPLLSWCDETGINWGGADVDLLSISAYNNGLYAKRMTSPGTYDDIEASLAQCQLHQGRVTQIGVWRTETDYGMRLRSSGGTTLLSTLRPGDTSTVDPSGRVARVGVSNIMGWPETITNAHDFRIYRVSVENLARSEREPISVLDADYARRVGTTPSGAVQFS